MDKTMQVGYAPAAFLIDEQFMVRGCYGNTEPYLRATSDIINVQLFKIVRDELVFELSDLIKQAGHFGKEIKKDGIVIGAFGHTRKVSVEIVSLRSFGRNWWLIVIRDAPPAPAASQSDNNPERLSKELRIEVLEKRLHEMRGLLMAANEQATDTRQTLQRMVEQTTAIATKLQTYNHELQALAEYGLAIIDGLRYDSGSAW